MAEKTRKIQNIQLYLLGQVRVVRQARSGPEPLPIQPKPLRLLAYLALNWQRPHRREELQALFWPDKRQKSAANNLRQALWHLRQTLPPHLLDVSGDEVRWNPDEPPWVEVLAFEAALDAADPDAALDLYAGPLLPDTYDEWAQLERERLQLRYLGALELRAHRRYEARSWEAALADADTLLAADPLNETAARLLMACYWALDQREAARRAYDAYRGRIRRELGAEPLPETNALYQRILCGEAHPHLAPQPADETIAAQTAHLSLLETLGAFRQGLEQATALAAQSGGSTLATARHWQGRFHLRLGQLADAREALRAALPLADTPDLKASILGDLATTETGLGNYAAAENHYAEALDWTSAQATGRARLLGSLGGLLGRLGRVEEARQALEEAIGLARERGDLAALAVTSGNLGILLLGQGQAEMAEATLQEALDAARQADAHWLTAHLTGHLGLLAQDRDDLETAALHYERARTLAETFGAQRGAALWTLNVGVVRYEQGRYADALQLLTQGHEQATAQGSRSLEAGASIFLGSCLVALGDGGEGLAHIEDGLALAQTIGDRERILMGLLHRGRALATLDRITEARAVLQDGLAQAESPPGHRLASYLHSELEQLPPLS